MDSFERPEKSNNRRDTADLTSFNELLRTPDDSGKGSTEKPIVFSRRQTIESHTVADESVSRNSLLSHEHNYKERRDAADFTSVRELTSDSPAAESEVRSEEQVIPWNASVSQSQNLRERRDTADFTSMRELTSDSPAAESEVRSEEEEETRAAVASVAERSREAAPETTSKGPLAGCSAASHTTLTNTQHNVIASALESGLSIRKRRAQNNVSIEEIIPQRTLAPGSPSAAEFNQSSPLNRLTPSRLEDQVQDEHPEGLAEWEREDPMVGIEGFEDGESSSASDMNLLYMAHCFDGGAGSADATMSSFAEAQAGKLSTFVAISDLSEEVSVGILEANAWNLEIAIEMLMSINTGGGGGQEQHPLPPPQLQQQHSAHGAEQELPASYQMNQSNASESESPPIRASAARDAQYEAHRASLSHGSNGAGDYAGTGGIRAPIPRNKEGLVDPMSSRMVMPAGPEEVAEEAIDWMFPPPHNILDNRDLDTLCRECSNVPCWLLVNIQDHTVLASHHLNRIWANETIQAILESNFKLTQMQRNSAKGAFFMTGYGISPDELPLTVVIDPRMGGIVLELVGCPSEEGLRNSLSDFLDMNDMSQPPAIRSNIVRQVSYGGVDEGEGNASENDEEVGYDNAGEAPESSQRRLSKRVSRQTSFYGKDNSEEEDSEEEDSKEEDSEEEASEEEASEGEDSAGEYAEEGHNGVTEPKIQWRLLCLRQLFLRNRLQKR